MTKTIRWKQPTESGLADRLFDLHFMAALARVQNAQIYTKWQPLFFKANDVPHRKQDILIENVRAHISFPEEIVIDEFARCDVIFDEVIGAKAPYHELWNQYGSCICSWDVFEMALQHTAKGFTFCQDIVELLDRLPAHFCALHVRRGDKVRDEPHDGCFIETHELSKLDDLTFRSIDWALRGFKQFFVCGDEDHKTKPFVDYICQHGGEIVEIPQLEKWRMTYYDLAVMTRSEFNITSQRRSTFSSFPALIGKGNYKTVYDLNRT